MDLLQSELNTVRDANSSLRGQIAQLHLDWAEMLEKVTSWTNRAAARDRKAIAKNLDATPQGDVHGAPDSNGTHERSKAELRSIVRSKQGR